MLTDAIKALKKLLLLLSALAYLAISTSQFNSNELEEDYNSSVVYTEYIDFDGDGVFDFEDDFETSEKKSKNSNLTLYNTQETVVLFRQIFSIDRPSKSSNLTDSLFVRKFLKPPRHS